MSHDLLTQLAEYGTYCEERQGTVTADDVTDAVIPLPMPTQPTRPRHGWLIAAAVAALVLLVAGGLALLAPFGGDEVAPINEPAATTIPATVPTTGPATDAVVTTTTPQTDQDVAPAIPPVEGPRLTFIQADGAPNVDLSKGVWFNGAMYALGQDFDSVGRTLHRSTDGLRWEIVTGLPASVGDKGNSLLETDGDRLVNMVIQDEGTSIEVFTSLDGDNWRSAIIQAPIPIGPNMAGVFQLRDDSGRSSGGLAVGSKGIVVAATVGLSFEAEGFANGLVSPDEGIHVEVVDLDIDRGVMVVRFLDENNDMVQIGELEEIDLNSAGFSGAFSNLLEAMAADPDWKPKIEPFIAELTSVYATGLAGADVGFAFHSPDGTNWKRIESIGPLDNGSFDAILATADGFVATASRSQLVWESADGTTWTQASGLASRHVSDESHLAEWNGEIIERVGYTQRRENDTEVWTLTDPGRAVFPDVSTQGMRLEITELGLIGTPTYGWEEPDKMEILFSSDGESWNRWEPSEFGQGTSGTEAWLVGVGPDFVAIQTRDWKEASGSDATLNIWVGRLP